MKIILEIILWLNILIPTLILAFYLVHLIWSEGKCWDKLHWVQKRNVKKNIIFAIWLIMALFWTGCLYQREKESLKHEQEIVLQDHKTALEQHQEQREQVVQILNKRHFLYLPPMRLRDIRKIIGGEDAKELQN